LNLCALCAFAVNFNTNDIEYMNKPKILVADDIKQNVKLLKVILTASEYDVIEAYDGEETLEKVQTENPDLILLDIMMPKLSGFEVCKKLRANDRTKNIPVIMITALHEMDDRIKGIEAGADDFISKPFNKVELLARIKSLLSMRQTTTEKKEITDVLESILPGLEEGVVVTDGQWKIKNINQTAKKLLNIHETDTANIDLQTHLSCMNLSIPMDTLRTTREKTTDFQILPANTQTPVFINARMTKLFDDHGSVVSISLVMRKEVDR
jgi:two-component system, cell cycle response regulator